MKLNLLAAASFAALLGWSARAVAAPVPFAQPPTMPGLAQTLHPGKALAAAAAAPGAPPPACIPEGSVSRQGAVLSVQLVFKRGRFMINNPDPSDPQPNHWDPVELRSYGGCQSGPTMVVRPGDTLDIDLVNKTDPNDPSCLPAPPPGLGVPPGVGCYNTTNLHTHGLHVSPTGNSDNVLLSIAPQTTFPYEVNVPADHPSGTFWYHAHRHGSTATQVASGASGFLIIQGDRPYTPPTPQNPHPIADIDTILHDPTGQPLTEQLFLFQQIAYACFQNDPGKGPWWQLITSKGLLTTNTPNSDPAQIAPWTCPISQQTKPVSPGVVENFALQLDSPTIWDTNGRFTSINGVVQPSIAIHAGEIQRWRFLHAGIHDTINVQIVRASLVNGKDLIAASALAGNREQQAKDVEIACAASPATLVPQFEIASDGLTRTKINQIYYTKDAQGRPVLQSNYLQPGYRSDVLVVFPTAGNYCLLDQAAPKAERVINGNGNGGQGPSTPQLLAYIQVLPGPPVNTPTDKLQGYVENALVQANSQLPPTVLSGLGNGDLTPWAPFIEEPAPTGFHQANFSITGVGNGVVFQVNGQSYDPNTINFTSQVNTTDDWLLTSGAGTPVNQSEPHIFHIHVNPFEVMDVTTIDAKGNQVSIFNPDGTCNMAAVMADQQELANQYCGMHHVFKDTVIVENGYQVHVRTTYDRYIGTFVIHCHILDHEDGGMMANIKIVPNTSLPGGGMEMNAMHHPAPVAAPAAPAAPAMEMKAPRG